MRTVLALIRLALAALVLLTVARAHQPPPRDPDALADRLVPHLRSLQARAEDGGAQAMQGLFPEGFAFTHALVGLAWVEVGLGLHVDDPRRAEALDGARRARDALRSPTGTAPFPEGLPPTHGAFYDAWTTQVVAGIVALQPEGDRDPTEVADLRASCGRIAAALDAAPDPFLASYRGQSWPADSVVLVSNLARCDALIGTRFRPTIDRWLVRARLRADPDLGVLGHATAWRDRRPRGTSLTLMLRFLHDLDPAWAAEHYRVFRDRFVTTRGGLPAVQEHLDGRGGWGDVDSGPLPLGVSLSATVVGAGVARMYGDDRLADAIFGVGEGVGLPLAWPGARVYGLGLLPVGEAFAAWSHAARPWHEPPPAVTPSTVPRWGWRLPWEGPPVGLALLLLPWPRRGGRRRTSPEPA